MVRIGDGRRIAIPHFFDFGPTLWARELLVCVLSDCFSPRLLRRSIYCDTHGLILLKWREAILLRLPLRFLMQRSNKIIGTLLGLDVYSSYIFTQHPDAE